MKQIYLMVKDCLCGIPSDKYLHCLICLVMTQLLMLIPGVYAWMAIIIVFCIGVLKELFDKFIMHTLFDMEDLAADVTGIAIGAMIAMLM